MPLESYTRARSEAAKQRLRDAQAKSLADGGVELGWLTPVLSTIGTVGGAIVGGPGGAAAGGALLGGVGSLVEGAAEGDPGQALSGATTAAKGLSQAGGGGRKDDELRGQLFEAFQRGRAARSRSDLVADKKRLK